MRDSKKWEVGQDRVLVVDIREGQPNRRRFFTIEAKLPNRRVMRGEIIFCQYEEDRDYILSLIARADAAEDKLRASIELTAIREEQLQEEITARVAAEAEVETEYGRAYSDVTGIVMEILDEVGIPRILGEIEVNGCKHTKYNSPSGRIKLCAEKWQAAEVDAGRLAEALEAWLIAEDSNELFMTTTNALQLTQAALAAHDAAAGKDKE